MDGQAQESFDIVHKLMGISALGTEWVLWLLIALSICSFAVILERGMFFFKMKMNMFEFTEKLTKNLEAMIGTQLKHSAKRLQHWFARQF